MLVLHISFNFIVSEGLRIILEVSAQDRNRCPRLRVAVVSVTDDPRSFWNRCIGDNLKTRYLSCIADFKISIF